MNRVLRFSEFLIESNKNAFESEILNEGGAYGKVACLECGKHMKQIQYRHLKFSHNMTMEEYKEKYPNAILVSESAKNFGEGNPMSKPENREKHLKSVNTPEYKNKIREHSTGRYPSDETRQKMSENNAMNHEVYRKAVSDGVKESYNKNPELRNLRRDNMLGREVSYETREKMYSSGKWLRPEEKTEFSLYYEKVKCITEENYNKYFYQIPNAKLRSREYHLDHKFSVNAGYRSGISEEVIGHYKNLEVIHHSINESKGGNCSISINDLFREIETSEYYIEKDKLFCGGAYGHLSHPFEDMNLTMNDLYDMIQTTVKGAFGPENFVQEKTDGQQLSISWKDGKLIAARNKGHLKNAGVAALDLKGVADLYAGRGDIETVYNAAMKDLSSSIGAISQADKDKYFANGAKFASLEVISPTTQNTVPYGLNMLVFHGVLDYDLEGNAIGEDKQAARELGKLVKDANAEAQESFFVRGPQDMEIKPFPDTAKRAAYYENKYKALLKETGLNSNSSVFEYAMSMGKRVILEEAEKANIILPDSAIDGLAARIAGVNKSYTVPTIKKELGENAEWFINLEKTKAKDLKARVYAPIESLFLEIGTEFMKNMSSFLSANPTAAAESMRKEIDETINKIKTSGNEEDVKKLERQLLRVTAAGGLDAIVPTEGITFIYKGKLYKFTGIFMAIHQIRSILAYKK